jgi:hypothetical protein
VLGRAVLKPRAKETDQVTSNRTVATVLVGLKGPFLLHEVLPGPQQLLGLPLAIRQSGPAAPHGLRRQPEIGKSRNDCPTALAQATAEQHPQQIEETQISTDRHASHHTRQNTIDTVEYGGHQGRLLQIEIG